MMHGNGKSDPEIVAVKPANKAERSATELVEQRAGTEGNADQQSTRRAQDRVSVSQALGRIRQAAKQRKKEKFTSLFHHISAELLRLSFFELKKDAAPGVDGMTWQDYEPDLDHKIEDLRARVQGGTYRALPSRRHYLPSRTADSVQSRLRRWPHKAPYAMRFGEDGGRRDELATQCRSVRSVSSEIVMAYGSPGFLRWASMRPRSIQ
jgi:hypothetical protein